MCPGLAGQLEPQEPKAATPPPVAPRPSPLTWSLQAPKAATPTSLRDILDQEAAQSTAAAAAASIPKAAARSSPSPSGSRGHRGSSDGGGPWPGSPLNSAHLRTVAAVVKEVAAVLSLK